LTVKRKGFSAGTIIPRRIAATIAAKIFAKSPMRILYRKTYEPKGKANEPIIAIMEAARGFMPSFSNRLNTNAFFCLDAYEQCIQN